MDSDADPNTGLTGTVTVNSGETDLTVDAGFYEPASLGDFVWSDTDADGIQDAGEPGIGGVTVNLLDGGGAFLQTTTTALDGSYSFTNLAPGDYIVEFIGPAGFAPSPQDQGGDDTIDSDANPGTGQTGIITLSSGENDPTNDAGYYESAFIGDFVWQDTDGDGIQDAGEPGIPGVTVNLYADNNQDGVPDGAPIATDVTGANGEYGFPVDPGSYVVEFVTPGGFDPTGQDQGGDDTVDSDPDPNTGLTGTVTVNSGETDLTVDAGFYEPASLGDFVWSDTDADGIQDAGEPGIGGVTVNLLDGGGAFLQTTTTALDGSYSFTNLAPGDYIVEFIGPAGFDSSPQDQGGDDTVDSDADPVTGLTGVINLESGETDPTNDAGFFNVIDLELEKSVNNTAPQVGSNVTFTVVLTNQGPSTATGVSVTDQLPSGYTFVSHTTSQGSYVSGTGAWTVGTLTAGQSVTLTITATVNASGDYMNLAEVTAQNEPDIDSSPNNGVDTDGDGAVVDDPGDEDDGDGQDVVPGALVDLELEKSVDNSTPNVGSNVTFTVVLTNQGPSTATGVSVTDQLPSGYTYVSNTASQGSYNSGTGAWSVGTLTAGQSVTLTITATVNVSGNYLNLAEVSTQNEPDIDSNPGNGVDTDGDGDSTDDPGDEDDGDGEEVFPVPVVDLELEKSVNNTTPNVGDNVTFTVVLTNQGPNTATGVAVTDQLPSGYTYVSHTASDGTYNSGTGLWTVGTMTAGSNATLTITATVNASGDYMNLAEVTNVNQDDVDSTPNNGVDTDGDGNVVDDPGDEDDGDGQDVNPGAVVDLELEKSVDNTTPNVGGTVTFTIALTNQGPSTATGVSVTDQLPSGYTYVSNTASQGSYNSGTGAWAVGTLTAGQSVTLTLTATVNASGDYMNLAEVTAQNEPDIDSSPNNGVDTDGDGAVVDDPGDEDDGDGQDVLPNAVVDLELEKSVNNTAPQVGSNVTFTVVLTNQGPSTATGVSVTDQLPSGYTFVSHTTSQGSYVSGTGAWTVGTLTAGQSVTLTITATVNASGDYMNLAEVTAQNEPDIDSNPNNGVDTDGDGAVVDDPGDEDDGDGQSVNPGALVDLELEKSVDNPTPNVGSNITFTVVLTNQGPSMATGVTVTDQLPSGYTYVSHTASQGNYNNGTGAWTVGTLTAGQSVTLSVTATVNVSGNYLNLAEVTTQGEPDVDSTPNSGVDTDGDGDSTDDPGDEDDGDGAETTPVPVIDLELEKTVDNTAPTVGDNITFTVVLTNQGPNTATGVAARDQLPSGYTYVSHTATDGTYNPGTGAWTVGTLTAGGSATLTITATVNPTGNYMNLAQVTNASQQDVDSTPNNGVDTDGDGNVVDDPGDEDDGDGQDVVPGALVDLELEKSVDNTTPNVGSNVTFTVVLTNQGPSTATGVAVTDQLPSGYTYVSNTASQGSYNSGTGLWSVGTLTANQSVTLTLTATVNASVAPNAYLNLAEVTAQNEPDADSSPNNGVDTDGDGNVVDDPGDEDDGDAAEVTVQLVASVTIEKSTNGQDADTAPGAIIAVPTGGATVNWQYVVTNTGQVGLSNLVVTDDQEGIVCTIPFLAAGASTTCNLSGPAQLGQYANLATVTGQPVDGNGTPFGNPVTDTDPSHYAGIFINVEKLADRTEICAGEEVTFTLRVRMLGGAPGIQLRDVSVVDNNLPGMLMPYGQYWVGGDLNGNGYIDFIDNDNDGNSDEEFVWTYSLSYTQTTTNTAMDEAVVWFVDPNTNQETNTGVVVMNTDDVTVTVNQNLCASLGDFVWDDEDRDGIQDVGEPGIGGVTVNLLDGNGNFLQTTTTAPDGSYSFTELVPGDYIVEFITPGGYDATTANVGNDALDSDAVGGQTGVINLSIGENDDTNDAGFYQLIDLELIKTVNDNTPNVGDVVTFTITVFNQGPQPATGVAVEDVVPNGYSGIANITGGGVLAGSTISWSGLNIAVGGSVTLSFQATVEAPGIGVSYLNVAQVTAADQFDTDSTPDNDDGDQSEDDEDNAVVTPAFADLELIKVVNDNTPNVGDVVTFTITVFNQGPDNATNVSVQDVVPNGYSGVGNISGGGSLSGNTITWSGLNITAGGSVALTFEATVEDLGVGISYLNVAQVTASDQFDPDSTPNNDDGDQSEDDEDNEIVTPGAIVDLELEKSVNNTTPQVGSNVTFTVALSNQGPSTATGVAVTDQLPSGYTYVSNTASQGTYNNATGVWTVATLAAGGSATLTLTATVRATGDYMNLAQVTAQDQPDADSAPGNGVDTDGDGNVVDDPGDEDDGDGQDVVPGALVDLELEKSVNNAAPQVGSNVTFTVALSNQGPSAATGVAVTDQLPSGYTYVSSTASQGTYASGTGLWSVGTLAAGGSATLTITATVNVSGSYLNLAEVTAQNEPDVDSTPGNGVDTDGDGDSTDDPGDEDDGDGAETTPVPAIDLELEKTVDNAAPTVGGNVTFTVVLTNQGPNTATGVAARDQLPSGYTYVSHSATDGTYNPATGAWTVGTLAAGGSATLTITATVNASGNYMNLAQVTNANQPDVDSSPNNGVDTDGDGNVVDDPGDEDDGDGQDVQPNALVDLELEKSVNNATPVVGSSVTFTVVVSNQGPSAATGVAVTDQLPSGYTYAGFATSQGTYNNATGVWNVGTLAAGSSATLTLTATVRATGNYMNLAQVTAQDQPDADSAPDNGVDTDGDGNVVDDPGDEDDGDGQDVAPNALVDLQLEKSVNNTAPQVGSSVTFTVVLTNQGPSTATGVAVTDQLPSGYTYSGFTTSQGTYNNGTGVWSVGTLAAGGSATLTLTATVRATGDYMNLAQVTAQDQPDADSAPNNGVDTDGDGNVVDDPGDEDDGDGQDVTPGALVDLELEKSVNNPTPQVGSNVTFTVVVSNQGPSAATGVAVTDQLPGGYTYVSSAASQGTYASGTGLWSVGTLAAGGSATLTITATVNVSGSYLNLAEVTAQNEPDTDSTPNNGVDTDGDGDSTDDPGDEDDGDGAETTPVPAIDLELEKTVDNAAPTVGGNVTFTVVLTNQGPNTATGVAARDQLPSGYTYVSHATTDGTYNPATGAWAVGTLAAGGSATLTITATVNATGNYMNLAQVTAANQQDVDSTPNNGVDTDGDGNVVDDPGDEDDGDGQDVVPGALVDLELEKSVNNATPVVGSNVTFTVVVSNQGPSTATGVSVTDQLPSGYTYTGFTTSQGTYNNATGVWNVGTLAAGGSATLTLTATVRATGNYMNLAQVTAQDQPDVDSAPNNGVDTDGDGNVVDDPGDEDDGDGQDVVPGALVDLELEKSVNNTAPQVGSSVTFTVVLTNQGPSTATGVAVTDQLPSGYSYTGFTTSQGTYNNATGVWTVGTLAAGGSATLTLTATVNATGNYMNLAQVTAQDQPDADSAPGNGVDTDGDGNVVDDPGDEDDGDGQNVVPGALVDLELEKSVNNPTPNVGSTVTFTVVLSNQGPSTATGVVVTDQLPGGYTYVSSTASQGTYTSGTGAWNVGTLTAGQSVTLAITATVNVSGSYLNLAEVTAQNEPDVDSTPGNGVDTDGDGDSTDDPGDEDDGDGAEVTPVPAIDLELEKTVDNAAPTVGGNVTFTVVLTNQGPNTATGVAARDQLPSGYTYVSHATTDGTYNPATGAWAVGTLAAGGSATLTVTATVNASGQLHEPGAGDGRQPAGRGFHAEQRGGHGRGRQRSRRPGRRGRRRRAGRSAERAGRPRTGEISQQCHSGSGQQRHLHGGGEQPGAEHSHRRSRHGPAAERLYLRRLRHEPGHVQQRHGRVERGHAGGGRQRHPDADGDGAGHGQLYEPGAGHCPGPAGRGLCAGQRGRHGRGRQRGGRPGRRGRRGRAGRAAERAGRPAIGEISQQHSAAGRRQRHLHGGCQQPGPEHGHRGSGHGPAAERLYLRGLHHEPGDVQQRHGRMDSRHAGGRRQRHLDADGHSERHGQLYEPGAGNSPGPAGRGLHAKQRSRHGRRRERSERPGRRRRRGRAGRNAGRAGGPGTGKISKQPDAAGGQQRDLHGSSKQPEYGAATGGVVVTDQLPSGYTYVSSTASQGTYNSSTGMGCRHT
ncbi:MAG: DUF11 domain-containing protein [Lewinellaceae bacterium]|nr:DUF11 domain-containing protein [Lewinellaceae bacterium]